MMSMVKDRSTLFRGVAEIRGERCIDTVTTFARSGLVRDGPVARCGSLRTGPKAHLSGRTRCGVMVSQ